jgi:hypothetical protein
LVFFVANVYNINAGAFHQFTVGQVVWVGLWIFMRPFSAGAEGFRFNYYRLECCALSGLVWFIVFLL